MRKIKDNGRTYKVGCLSWKDCETGRDCITNDNPYCKMVLRETLPSRLSRFIKRMVRK